MSKILKYASAILLAMTFAAFAYGGKGYFDALADADTLALRADALISDQRGGVDVGEGRLAQILTVQDPAFYEHSGVDLTTPGAGVTTVSQSLSKRLAFEKFTPGIRKLRQTGYALGLERVLEKDQIIALWLDRLEMGRGPDGWMVGFFHTSDVIYGRPPDELTDEEFLRLIAVLIAPASFDLRSDDPDLDERADRIARLVSGECSPQGNGDVWYEAC